MPRKCIGMKMEYTPTRVNQKGTFPQPSCMRRPNILGNQQCIPAKTPKRGAQPRVGWEGATPEWGSGGEETGAGPPGEEAGAPRGENRVKEAREKDVGQ